MTLTCSLLLAWTVVFGGSVASTHSPVASPDKPTEKSERGAIQRIKGRTLSMRVDGHSRDIILEDKTVLLDVDGSVRARGPKAIAPLVSPGMNVVVVWTPFWVMDGAGQTTSFYRRAIEIRIPAVAALPKNITASQVIDATR
jgi:hypothetical protein